MNSSGALNYSPKHVNILLPLWPTEMDWGWKFRCIQNWDFATNGHFARGEYNSLGLESATMVKYGISNIRAQIGSKVGLKMVK